MFYSKTQWKFLVYCKEASIFWVSHSWSSAVEMAVRVLVCSSSRAWESRVISSISGEKWEMCSAATVDAAGQPQDCLGKLERHG